MSEYGAGEPVEFGDDQGVPAPAGGHRLPQTGAGAVGAGESVVDVDPVGVDAESGQGVALSGEVLAVGGDPGVADQDPRRGWWWASSFRPSCRPGPTEPSRLARSPGFLSNRCLRNGRPGALAATTGGGRGVPVEGPLGHSVLVRPSAIRTGRALQRRLLSVVWCLSA